jgi:hypothetical protein
MPISVDEDGDDGDDDDKDASDSSSTTVLCSLTPGKVRCFVRKEDYH